MTLAVLRVVTPGRPAAGGRTGRQPRGCHAASSWSGPREIDHRVVVAGAVRKRLGPVAGARGGAAGEDHDERGPATQWRFHQEVTAVQTHHDVAADLESEAAAAFPRRLRGSGGMQDALAILLGYPHAVVVHLDPD